MQLLAAFAVLAVAAGTLAFGPLLEERDSRSGSSLAVDASSCSRVTAVFALWVSPPDAEQG